MTTKLTLSIEKEVIEQAKMYAKKQGRSLSNLVSQFLMSLNDTTKKEDEIEISPEIKSLQGLVKLPKDFDYKKDRADYLLKKYLELDEQ